MLFRKGQARAIRSSRLLVFLFIILVIILIVAINGVLTVVWHLIPGPSTELPNYFYVVNTGLVLLYVFGSYAVEIMLLKGGGEVLAKQAGGIEIDSPNNIHEKRVRNVVMEVAVAAGVKPPRVFLLSQEQSINAFAAGWDLKDSVIAVTRGSMERLTRDELQGVVAHEFSHILNGDMRLNMRLMSMVLGLQLLYNFGSTILLAGGHQARIPARILIGLALMGAGWFGWLGGRILSASVSRQREFLADASAVQFTRYTEGIAGALRKIAYQQEEGRGELEVREAERLAPMFLNFKMSSKWLATHPPISERLKRLGVPYTRFEQKDEFQNVRVDEFMPARLVPEGELTPHLKMAAARWGGIGLSQQIASVGDSFETHLTMDAPSSTSLEETQSELYLRSDLSLPRIKSAILAYWVPSRDGNECRAWEDICRNWETQLPYRAILAVNKLAPSLREPMFEELASRVQVLSIKEREHFAKQAWMLCEHQEKKEPIDWLRASVLTYWMGEFRESMSNDYTKLVEVQDAVALLTSFMANALNVSDKVAWTQAVMKELELSGTYHSETTKLELRKAVRKVHDGVSLFAPRIVMAWVRGWRKINKNRSEPERQQDANVLRLISALLDTHLPLVLQGYFEDETEHTPVFGLH